MGKKYKTRPVTDGLDYKDMYYLSKVVHFQS